MKVMGASSAEILLPRRVRAVFIYGMTNGLLEAGGTLKYVYDPDPKKVEAFVKAYPQIKSPLQRISVPSQFRIPQLEGTEYGQVITAEINAAHGQSRS